MAVPRDKRPPSPPMTDSSTKSSSPSLLSTVSSAAETPPRSPDTLITTPDATKSPRSPSSPLFPLPPEVFLSVLRFLPRRDQLRACLVSRPWYAFISGEPRFWTTISVSLEYDDLDSFQQALFRVVGNGNKKREGLKDLKIIHWGHFDKRSSRWNNPLPIEDAVERFKQVVRLAHDVSTTFDPGNGYVADPATTRYSTLRKLRLVFAANCVDSIYLLHELAKLSSNALFFNLETLSIFAGLPGFQLDKSILAMMPRLRSLSLRFAPSSTNAVVRVGNWMWHVPVEENSRRIWSLDRLEDLTIHGAMILHNLFLPPALPSLRKLVLTEVTWVGKALFRLLRLARQTLEHLELDNFSFEILHDEWEDWCNNVDIRDPNLTDGWTFRGPRASMASLDFEDPCPILFDQLGTLILSGRTPPLFANLLYSEDDVEMEEYPTPVFVMPRLVVARITDLSVDPDPLEYQASMPPPLVILGQNAPNLERLEVTSCMVEDDAVFACLASMHARLLHLDLYDSTVTDLLLSHLPQIVPSLRTLDVRLCAGISCQGVARLVEVIRQVGDEGQYRIEQVFVDPPESSHYDLKAYLWLDFIGVLRRDVDDFEGDGPSGYRERREWIREGKKDSQWQYKEMYRQKEEAAARARQAAAQQLELLKMQNGGGGGSGSSSGRTAAGGGGRAVFQTNLGAHDLAPTFAPPPPHQNYHLSHPTLVSMPQAQPPSTFVLPNLPSNQLLPAQHPTTKYHVPMAQTVSNYASTSPNTAKTPNLTRLVTQSQESKLDLASLDCVTDLNELPPELIREQQLALEEIQRSHPHLHPMSRTGGSGGAAGYGNRGVGGGGGGGDSPVVRQVLSQDEAYAAAHKRVEEGRTASEEQQARTQRQQAVFAVTGQPENVPTFDPRMSGLETIRNGGGGGGGRRYTGFAVDEDGVDLQTEEIEPRDDEIEEGKWEDLRDELDEDEILEYGEDVSNETDALHPNALA